MFGNSLDKEKKMISVIPGPLATVYIDTVTAMLNLNSAQPIWIS